MSNTQRFLLRRLNNYGYFVYMIGAPMEGGRGAWSSCISTALELFSYTSCEQAERGAAIYSEELGDDITVEAVKATVAQRDSEEQRGMDQKLRFALNEFRALADGDEGVRDLLVKRLRQLADALERGYVAPNADELIAEATRIPIQA